MGRKKKWRKRRSKVRWQVQLPEDFADAMIELIAEGYYESRSDLIYEALEDWWENTGAGLAEEISEEDED